MSTFTIFYKNYVRLCAAKGVSLSRAATDIGLSRTAPNGWKNGKIPSDTTLTKIADYFKVTADSLMEPREQQKEPAANNDELSERQKADLVFSDLSDEEIEKVLDYIAFIKSKRVEE